MEQHLQFKIGSTFSGEGFTKLRGAVVEVNKTVRASSSAISQVSNTIGEMDGKAAKAVSALTSLITSFMTLNPVMLGITAATTALSWGIKILKEREEEAQKRTDDLRKSLEGLATKLNDKIFNKAVKDAASIGNEFERITKHANDMTSAMNALTAAQAKGGALDLQVTKIQKVIDEVSDEGKRLAAAEWDVQLAYKNEADVRATETAKVTAAHQAVVDEENRIANLEKQRSEMLVQLGRLESNNHTLKVAEKSVREKLLKQIEDMKDKVADVDGKIIASKDKLQVLNINEQTATQNMNNALVSATMEITRSEDAQKRLIASIDESKEAERMRADAVAHELLQEEELKAAEKEKADALKASTDVEREAAEAARNLKEAQANLAAAIRAYEDNYTKNRIWEEVSGASGNGINGNWRNLNEAGNSKLIQEGAAVIAGERALASGAVRTVEGLRQVEQQAMRDARAEMSSKETAQMMREAERADRLRKMSDKAMSQADRDWLAKYDDVKNANDAQQREVEAAKLKQMFARWREEDAQEAVIEINQRLKKLGLK